MIVETDFRVGDIIQFQRERDAAESFAIVKEVQKRSLVCRPFPDNPKAFDFCLVVGIDWIVVAVRDGQKYERKECDNAGVAKDESEAKDDDSWKEPLAKLFYAKGRKKIKKRKGPTR